MNPVLSLLLVSAALSGLSGCCIASERDPTRPPDAALAPAAPVPGAVTSATPATAATDPTLLQRMVIGGKPYLVERGWLRGVGDRIGDARIERITEHEIWLRSNGALRKWPIHPNVQIQALPEPSASAARPTAHPRALPAATSKDHRP